MHQIKALTVNQPTFLLSGSHVRFFGPPHVDVLSLEFSLSNILAFLTHDLPVDCLLLPHGQRHTPENVLIVVARHLLVKACECTWFGGPSVLVRIVWRGSVINKKLPPRALLGKQNHG